MDKVLRVKIALSLLIIITASFFVVLIKKLNYQKVFELSPSPAYRQKIVGNEAKIVIYEFSDFSCPACMRMHFYLKDLVNYFNYIRIDFRHYPLTNIHPNALKAAVWAECAGMNYGKFWEFADLLFSNRDKWSNSADAGVFFEDFSKKLSMDINVMKNCVNSKEAFEMVTKDMKEADRLGVDSTPTFFVRGKKAVGGQELVDILKQSIK